MWNWLVSSLGLGGNIVLYEGSPAYPSFSKFMNILKQGEINIWGTSPKFLKALEIEGWNHNIELPQLESILSTGAPLLPEQFEFVYEKISSRVQLASICGGTDIIGCFMLGNPMRPVYPGQIQGPGLGMDIACFDHNGQHVIDQEGELVCLKPFISQPIGFLNDPNDEKIKNAYFNQYENTWYHGDFITMTNRNSVIVHGRSDATLNPGGVRIGTGEIYRQTEKIEFIKDSLCVAKERDGDVEIHLFVKTLNDETLTPEMKKQIKSIIRSQTTPRHVPKEIFQIHDIPYTRSGKKMELAVSRIINGRQLNNIEAVANPDSLKEYEKYVS
jgi:acetoacetyl-CoA synthetase